MHRVSRCLYPWWNYSTEQKNLQVLQAGGRVLPRKWPAIHKIYVKKYKRGHFPNRGRTHLNVAQIGCQKQRPHRCGWPYDMTSLIFNTKNGKDKVGYVVSTKMLKTSVVAANYMVYYPKYNQKVSRTGRYFAHDEDLSCVEGDLVHIKLCRKMSKYKHYYVFSIIEPNVEGRERLKLGLPIKPDALFGYPSLKRVMKLNLTSKSQSKEMLAAAMQEQVSQFYKFGGRVENSIPMRQEGKSTTFDEVHRGISNLANEQQISHTSGSDPIMGSRMQELPQGVDDDYTAIDGDFQGRRGKSYKSKYMDAAVDVENTRKSP